MTGPEHYRAAEVLLSNATDAVSGSPAERYFLAAAQAHATAALAAAIIDTSAQTNRGHEWGEAIGGTPS